MTCASADPEALREEGSLPAPVWGPLLGEQLYAVTPTGGPGAEAWIEAVQPSGGSVIVTLALADGSRGRSVLDGDCAEWLDLRPGEIVTVTAASAGDPGFPVVGQRVDLAGETVAGDVSQADGLQDAAHVRAQGDPDAL